MTSTAAFEMATVHRAFRNELHGVPATTVGSVWAKTGAPSMAQQLRAAVDELI
jgi:hypothetical protein